MKNLKTFTELNEAAQSPLQKFLAAAQEISYTNSSNITEVEDIKKDAFDFTEEASREEGDYFREWTASMQGDVLILKLDGSTETNLKFKTPKEFKRYFKDSKETAKK